MRFKLTQLEQGSQPWLDFRKDKIGASDIPAIVKVVGAYTKRSDLLYEKITGISKPLNSFTQALFDKGHEIEADARDGFNKLYGPTRQFVPAVVQSIENEKFFASLDGLCTDQEEVLEIKSTMKDEFLNLAKDGKIPEIYNVQIQWQLFITGYKKALCIVVDSRDRKANVVEVNRDDVLIGMIKLAAEEFLKEMNAGVSPYMNLESQEMRNISASIMQIKHFKKQIKDAETTMKLQAELLLKSFAASKIEGCGVVIDYEDRIGQVDYSAIPELKNVDLNKYRKPSSRSVRIKPSKGSDE